jgi:hypothetical protein
MIKFKVFKVKLLKGVKVPRKLPQTLCSGGDCFQSAGRTILNTHHPVMTREIRLVHGRVTHPGNKKRHGHAWTEIGDVVFDESNGKQYVGRKEHYYKVGKIRNEPGEYASYSHEEAMAKMAKHGNFGPWDLKEND